MTVVIKNEAAAIAALDKMFDRVDSTLGRDLFDSLLLLGVIRIDGPLLDVAPEEAIRLTLTGVRQHKFAPGETVRLRLSGKPVKIVGVYVKGSDEPLYTTSGGGFMLPESELVSVEDKVEESLDWTLHRALMAWHETNRSADAILRFIKQQGFVINRKE